MIGRWPDAVAGACLRDGAPEYSRLLVHGPLDGMPGRPHGAGGPDAAVEVRLQGGDPECLHWCMGGCGTESFGLIFGF